jgi:hypothetical protein
MAIELPADHDLRADVAAVTARRLPVERDAYFAGAAGVVSTAEGPVRHAAGAAIVSDAGGRSWPVERTMFEAHYEPVSPTRMGEPGRYRHRPDTVLARRMTQPFSICLPDGRGVLRGSAGDWLVQYGPREHGVVAARAFADSYAVDGPCPAD